MIYTKCPTCKQMLSHIMVDYEEKMNKINNDPDMSKQEIELQKQNIVNNYKLRRYCCNMRLMTYKSIVRIVK